MENLTTVGTYSQPYEAHIAQQRLKDQGIVAFLRNEHTISIDWFLSQALGGVRLMVPADRAEEARRILATDESPQLEAHLEDPIPCPACGSPDTDPFKARRFNGYLPILLSVWLIFMMGIMFVILVLPFFTSVPKLKCHTCQRISYIGKWPMRRLKKVIGLGTAFLVGAGALQIFFSALLKDYSWEDRDWNEDGNTTLIEYLESAFVERAPTVSRDCFDYYNRVTHKKLRRICKQNSLREMY